MDLLDRLARRIEFHESGCWIWLGYPNKNTGYGYAMLDGKNRLAHRAVYEALVEPITVEMTLDHLCRVRLCVNPDHLEEVTLGENLRRARCYRGRAIVVRPGLEISARPIARPLYCPKGHPYTKSNSYVRPNGVRNCRECGRLRGLEILRERRDDEAFRLRKLELRREWYQRHKDDYNAQRRAVSALLLKRPRIEDDHIVGAEGVGLFGLEGGAGGGSDRHYPPRSDLAGERGDGV
jgi:hypothetical protein